MSDNATKRLLRDLREWKSSCHLAKTINAAPLENDIFTWHCNFFPDQSSPLHGIIFHIEIIFTRDYPDSFPKVRVCNYLHHPNVFSGGNWICLDMLKPKGWCKAYSVSSILFQLLSFLITDKAPQENYGENTQNVKIFIPVTHSKSEIDKMRAESMAFQCNKCGHSFKAPKPVSPLQLIHPSKNESAKTVVSGDSGVNYWGKIMVSDVENMVLDFCEITDLLHMSRVSKAFKQLIYHSKYIQMTRFSCWYHRIDLRYSEYVRSKPDINDTVARDIVLGYGVRPEFYDSSRDRWSNKNDAYSNLKAIETTFDLVSIDAFENHNIKMTPISKRKYTNFIPMYVLHERYHGRAALGKLSHYTMEIFNADHSNEFQKFEPMMSIHIITSVMSSLVVELMKSIETKNLHHSINVLETYFHYYHLLLAVWDKYYDSVHEKVRERCLAFMNDPEARNKKNYPNLGFFMVWYAMLEVRYNSDITTEIFKSLLEEVLIRNVKWLIKSFGPAYETQTVHNFNISKSFEGQLTSLRLFMFQYYFMNQCCGVGLVTPKEKFAELNKSLGCVSSKLTLKLQEFCSKMDTVKQWREFFGVIDMKYPGDNGLKCWLRSAVYTSAQRKYHYYQRNNFNRNGFAAELKDKGSKNEMQFYLENLNKYKDMPLPQRDSQIQFRIFNIALTLRPYGAGGMGEQAALCIKPGGFEGNVKKFNFMQLGSRQQQYKKVGIRTEYSLKQLLNVRLKFLTLPNDMEVIPGVLEEGIGNFEVLTTFGTTQKVSTVSKLRKAPVKPGAPVKEKINNNVVRVEAKEETISPIKPVTPQRNTLSSKSSRYKARKDSEIKPKAGAKVTVDTSVSTSKSDSPVKSLSSGRGWKGGRNKQRDPMQKFVSKVRFKLNQITVDNFETLSERLISIFDTDVNDVKKLNKFVSLIFEKTVQEHVYGPLYAKLCVVLSSKNKSFEEISSVDGNPEIIKVDFKRELLKVCQTEFENGKREAKMTADMDATDIENEKIKQKRILMGTMKFIGQLYLKLLLPSKIMTVCLKHLALVSSSQLKKDNVEAACCLLQTVGITLDNDPNTNKKELTKVYSKLSSLCKSNKGAADGWIRMRILIQNLIDLRKNGWTESRNKAEQPSKLKKKSGTDMEDELDVLMLMLNNDFQDFNPDNNQLEIRSNKLPVKYIDQSDSKIQARRERYQDNVRGGMDKQPRDRAVGNRDRSKVEIAQQNRPQRREKRQRKLVETEPEMHMGMSQRKPKAIIPEQKAQEKRVSSVSVSGEIGRRKQRDLKGKMSDRPCVDGKALSEDRREELTGDYLGNRNGINRDKFITLLKTYTLENRPKFLIEFIRKSVDNGKGERLSDIIPVLLDECIITAQEFDNALMTFCQTITEEDTPQINRNTSQLLAPLLVDNELNFTDVLEWVILDIRANKSEEDLEFYDREGIRNYIRNSKTITKCMELLGFLMNELKEACFEDSQYVKKLLVKYRFKIDKYLNQKDIGNKEQIKDEWIQKYNLKFAF